LCLDNKTLTKPFAMHNTHCMRVRVGVGVGGAYYLKAERRMT